MMTGGCQCGAIRYRIDADPIVTYACHCTECQKASGSAFGLSMIFLATAFELTSGELAVYERETDAGGRLRCSFCRGCGNRIHHRPPESPFLSLKPGHLDDTSGLRPEAHIWVSSRPPWVEIPEDAPRHETQPEEPTGILTLARGD